MKFDLAILRAAKRQVDRIWALIWHKRTEEAASISLTPAVLPLPYAPSITEGEASALSEFNMAALPEDLVTVPYRDRIDSAGVGDMLTDHIWKAPELRLAKLSGRRATRH